MSINKSIRINYIYSLTFQILQFITPLITAPYVSRVLMADGVGTFSFAFTVVQYFNLFTGMGIAAFGKREISYFQDNRRERTRIFWELKCFSLINVIISMTIYITMAFLYAGDNLIIYLFFSLYILNVAIDPTWLFSGMEDFKKITLRSIIIKILDIVFMFMFVKKKSDLAIYVFGLAFFTVAGSSSLWNYLPQYIDKPDFKSLRPFRNIKTIWSLFVPTIAIYLCIMMDQVMIGVFTEGSTENGYYELAMRVVRVILMSVYSIGTVIVPRIGYLFGQNEHKRIQLYMYRSYSFVQMIAIPACLGLIVVSDNFVPWFFGEGYSKVAGLLKILCLLILAMGINNITGDQFLIPTKKQNIYTFTVVIGTIVNFTLNIILIIPLKAYGAAIASVVSEICIALAQFYEVRNELDLWEIAKSGRNYCFSGLIMFFILMIESRYLTPSAVHTFILVFSGAFMYIAMLLLLRDEFFIWNIRVMTKYIVNKLHNIKTKLCRENA